MHRVLLLLLFLLSSVNADFIEEYRDGKYKSTKDKIYLFDSISIHDTEYKKRLKSSIYADIASQISSLVSVSSSMSSESKNKTYYKEHFSYKSSATTQDIPLYSIRYLGKKVKNGRYYLLALFDFKVVLPLYLKKDTDLLNAIKEYYINSKRTTTLYKKEHYLDKVLESHKKLQKLREVISLIAPQKNLRTPYISLAKVNSELISLLDTDATNLQDLTDILAKRLQVGALREPIFIEPISLRDNYLYSEFSYIFVNFFTGSLRKQGVVSKIPTYYTAKGNYYLKKNRVIVSMHIQNSEKEIISSAIAYMKITEEESYSKEYQPFEKPSPFMKILDEYLDEW